MTTKRLPLGLLKDGGGYPKLVKNQRNQNWFAKAIAAQERARLATNELLAELARPGGQLENKHLTPEGVADLRRKAAARALAKWQSEVEPLVRDAEHEAKEARLRFDKTVEDGLKGLPAYKVAQASATAALMSAPTTPPEVVNTFREALRRGDENAVIASQFASPYHKELGPLVAVGREAFGRMVLKAGRPDDPDSGRFGVEPIELATRIVRRQLDEIRGEIEDHARRGHAPGDVLSFSSEELLNRGNDPDLRATWVDGARFGIVEPSADVQRREANKAAEAAAWKARSEEQLNTTTV